MTPPALAHIVAGLISEPENPYVSTALEELTSDLPESTSLAAKIAFAAWEIYDALEAERIRRHEPQASHVSRVGGPDDPARREEAFLGSRVPPIAFASGD